MLVDMLDSSTRRRIFLLIVFFESYHFSVVFQFFRYESENSQFFHCSFKLCELFADSFESVSVFGQSLTLCFNDAGGLSSFFGQPLSQSVIEEKGEGFENGKTDSWLSVVAPSTLALQYCISRLKI